MSVFICSLPFGCPPPASAGSVYWGPGMYLAMCMSCVSLAGVPGCSCIGVLRVVGYQDLVMVVSSRPPFIFWHPSAFHGPGNPGPGWGGLRPFS